MFEKDIFYGRLFLLLKVDVVVQETFDFMCRCFFKWLTLNDN